MSKSRTTNRFSLWLGATLLFLVVVILILIPISNTLGLSVSLNTTNPLEQISPYETLTLTFSQPVNQGQVESQLQLQPTNMGKLDWQNDHTLRIIPIKPHLGTLSVRLTAGKFGVNGIDLRKDASWTLNVRQPSIIYLSAADPKNELVVIPAQGGSPRTITATNGKVLGFDVSPTGDTIAYSIQNDPKGMDLWLADRNGQNARRLLECGVNNCYAPVWSPNSNQIAYSYETPAFSGGYTLPHLWLVDVATAETHAVFPNANVADMGTIWSPDGNWLATFNDNEEITNIHLMQLATNKEVSIPTHSDQLGSWSPDSKFLIHPDYVTDSNANILKNSLLRTDPETGKSSILMSTGSTEDEFRYGNPVLSPDGAQIALSMHSIRHAIPRLWVAPSDKPDQPIMTTPLGYNYDFYQWDPWGSSLLIQQTSLTKAYLYEVAVWNASQGYKVLGKNATFPRWLP